MQSNLTDKKIFCNVIRSIIAGDDKLKRDKSESPELAFDLLSGLQIVKKAKNIFNKEPAVLQINTNTKESDFAIVGDLHGSIDSLIRIFKEKGYPPKVRYLFLGDYVDRGKFSCEVIVLLYALKCLFPKDIYLIRGNHEFAEMTDFYGFKDECISRIKDFTIDENSYTGLSFYNLIIESFTALPICVIINDSIFCVHGGISSLLKNRNSLLKLNKIGNSFSADDFAQEEMLWNDPDKHVSMYKFSSRGRGCVYGKEAVKTFLQNMNFKLIIRGHQDALYGYDWALGPKGGVLTVFSVINYLKTNNNAAIAIVSKDTDNKLVEIQQIKKYAKFDAVNHVFTYPLNKPKHHQMTIQNQIADSKEE